MLTTPHRESKSNTSHISPVTSTKEFSVKSGGTTLTSTFPTRNSPDLRILTKVRGMVPPTKPLLASVRFKFYP